MIHKSSPVELPNYRKQAAPSLLFPFLTSCVEQFWTVIDAYPDYFWHRVDGSNNLLSKTKILILKCGITHTHQIQNLYTYLKVNSSFHVSRRTPNSRSMLDSQTRFLLLLRKDWIDGPTRMSIVLQINKKFHGYVDREYVAHIAKKLLVRKKIDNNCFINYWWIKSINEPTLNQLEPLSFSNRRR